MWSGHGNRHPVVGEDEPATRPRVQVDATDDAGSLVRHPVNVADGRGHDDGSPDPDQRTGPLRDPLHGTSRRGSWRSTCLTTRAGTRAGSTPPNPHGHRRLHRLDRNQGRCATRPRNGSSRPWSPYVSGSRSRCWALTAIMPTFGLCRSRSGSAFVARHSRWRSRHNPMTSRAALLLRDPDCAQRTRAGPPRAQQQDRAEIPTGVGICVFSRVTASHHDDRRPSVDLMRRASKGSC